MFHPPPPPPPGICKLQFFPAPTFAVQHHHLRQISLIERPVLRVLKSLMDGKSPWPLYLWSATPGTGKTSTALAMLDHCGLGWTHQVATTVDAHDAICGYLDFMYFPQVIRSFDVDAPVYSNDGKLLRESDIWQHIGKRRLVVVDDLEKASVDKHVLIEVLAKVLDVRANRPLIVNGNTSPDRLAVLLDDRIAGRVTSGTMLEMRSTST